MRIKTKSVPDGDRDPDASATALRFRVVHVFDISQTEGDPLPEPSRVTGEPGQHLEHILRAVRSSGITVELSASLGGADGLSKGGAIVIDANLTPAERFSVVVHEWAHELLHQGDPKSRPNKTIRETEAEAVAFVVSQAIGLRSGAAASDYIRLYNGDKETLIASLERVQKAADQILRAIEPQRAPKTNTAVSHRTEQRTR